MYDRRNWIDDDDDIEDDEDDDDDEDDNDDDDQRTQNGIIQSSSPNDWDIIASDLYGLDSWNRPYFFEAKL